MDGNFEQEILEWHVQMKLLLQCPALRCVSCTAVLYVQVNYSILIQYAEGVGDD